MPRAEPSQRRERGTRPKHEDRRRPMRAHMTWLDEAEKQSFVAEALGILERVGVALKGSAALPVLAELGADVDPSTGVVRLPPELVLRAVDACPRRVLFAGASPEHDVVLDEGEPARFCSSGCAASCWTRRPASASLYARGPAGGHGPLGRSPRGRRIWTTSPPATSVEVRELVVYFVVLTERASTSPSWTARRRRSHCCASSRSCLVGRGVPRAAAVQHAAHRGVAPAPTGRCSTSTRPPRGAGSR